MKHQVRRLLKDEGPLLRILHLKHEDRVPRSRSAVRRTMKMFVKAKDQVVVISGKDKGTKGKVVTAAPKTGKVVVEGVAVQSKSAFVY